MAEVKNLILAILLGLAACNSQPPGQQDRAIDQSQLMEFVLKEGDRISNQAQMALGGQLKQAMSAGGPSYAVQFCNLSASHILDTLTIGYAQVKIGRRSERLRNQANMPSELEHQQLEKYQRQVQLGAQLTAQLHQIGEAELLYTRPIMLNNPLCLNCHGSPEDQISKETYEEIKQHYPQDQAVNYQLGDLRGMWTIEFDRDEMTDSYLQQLSP